MLSPDLTSPAWFILVTVWGALHVAGIWFKKFAVHKISRVSVMPVKKSNRVPKKNKQVQGKDDGSSTKKSEKISRKTLWLLAFFSVAVALGTAFMLLSSFGIEEKEPTPITTHLIEFYGRECPHCARMIPIVAEVEKETGLNFSKLEVWHNSGNIAVFDSYSGPIAEACGGIGVPTYYNNKTKKILCGEVDKGTLLAFAKGN